MADRISGAPLSPTAHIILGMVAEGHSNGDTIKAEIERSTRPYWTVGVGGIYPELHRLHAAGLLSLHDDPRGGTGRRSYQITDRGLYTHRLWVLNPREPLLHLSDESLLRLRFAGGLRPVEQLHLVRQMRERHRRELEYVRTHLAAERAEGSFRQLTIEFAVDLNRWASDWCIALERVLAEKSR